MKFLNDKNLCFCFDYFEGIKANKKTGVFWFSFFSPPLKMNVKCNEAVENVMEVTEEEVEPSTDLLLLENVAEEVSA